MFGLHYFLQGVRGARAGRSIYPGLGPIVLVSQTYHALPLVGGENPLVCVSVILFVFVVPGSSLVFGAEVFFKSERFRGVPQGPDRGNGTRDGH